MTETLILDGEKTILQICPSEIDLRDIKTNIPCPVTGCSNIFKSSSNLTMHLEKYHKITESNQSSLEKKKNNNVIYQYYCPVKGCQYHNDLKLNKKKIFFGQLKYLKQHFMKVHSEKRFICSDCDKSFSIESALRRHQTECGIEFKCSCGQLYSSRNSLLLHASRKNHTVNEKYKRLKLYPAPVLKTSPVCILPKPIQAESAVPEIFMISTAPSLVDCNGISDHIMITQSSVCKSSKSLKEKHTTPTLKKKTDLSSLVKRKIVLKKFQNAQKLMKMKDTCMNATDFPSICKSEENIAKVSSSISHENNNSALSFESESSPNETNDLISQDNFGNSSWSKSTKAEISESVMVFPRTDINLNELNSSSKTSCPNGNIFDSFEFSNSPKLSQSTQTNEPSLYSLATTQTDYDMSFDDSNLCSYYDNFDFSNSPKLSQSTQTFQSSSQVSQTDIQSSFFDDSSNKSFLSELIPYYDNFETSNSPKLSQSTQTIGHSLCSWSDNVTQTDLDDQLFGDSSINQFDECYRNDSSFLTDESITKPIVKVEAEPILNRIQYCSTLNQTSSTVKTTDESVSTQTALSAAFQEDRRGKYILDELTTSQTQTESPENSFLLVSTKAQSFSSTQTQTSTSLNYLIDSETQTQELLNQLIDIQTQTYVSNFN